MAKSRLSKLEQSQDLNGILGRKKVQRGTGGPLLTSAPLGTKADAMSMEPASQATPWLPPTAKVPSISSLPEGADDAGNEMGLRPALQEEAPVSSGRSHVPNKISMSPVDPGRTGRGGGDTQYALPLGSFSSAELAETAWNRASRISEAQLSGMSHSIEAYSQPDGRSLFRLFAGALPDRRTALSLCSVLREKGATCIVVRR